jgi:SAM-dependent methyltransferase
MVRRFSIWRPAQWLTSGRTTPGSSASDAIRWSSGTTSFAPLFGVGSGQSNRAASEHWRQAPIDASTIARLCRPGREPLLTLDDAIRGLHTLGPRCRFIKTLPAGAAMLDAGAGDGTSQVYRRWPEPTRNDLQMFAWAGVKGSSFELYNGSEVGFWPDNPPAFGGCQFDAIMAANFIEHIDDPIAFVEWSISRLAPGGRLYLEWPRPEAALLPTTADLAALGLPIMTGNYFDDYTHRAIVPDFETVRATITGAGFILRESGIVGVPFVDQELAIHAARAGDTVLLTLAYWSMTGWCQYLVAEQASQAERQNH